MPSLKNQEAKRLPLPEKYCDKCGMVDVPRLTPGKAQHYAGQRCKHCGAWLGWLSKRYAPIPGRLAGLAPHPRPTRQESAPATDPAPSAQEWARHQARQRELEARLQVLLEGE